MDRRACLFGSATLLSAPTGSLAEAAHKVRRVGFLEVNTPTAAGHLTSRMRELGRVENRQFVVESTLVHQGSDSDALFLGQTP